MSQVFQMAYYTLESWKRNFSKTNRYIDMTTTQEHNQIIGKFIGWIPYNGLNPKWKYSFETNKLFHVPACVTQDELQFHTSWEWLMPVVKKISECNDYPRHLDIDQLNIFHSHGRVYNAVIQFIEWYNENKV